ncbi:arabinose 5-phosphate isomerase [Naviculisporaceae sp. PSN 640]
MVEQQRQPVHNSEVYLLNQNRFPLIPPPSPPSPITPAPTDICSPIESLSLDGPDPLSLSASCDEHCDEQTCDDRLVSEERLAGAVHVLSTETRALQLVTNLYSTDEIARDGFNRAVEAITQRQGDQGKNGKVVVIGVGKSGHIAKKLVATFNSLAIQAVFLHPTEALHGDLGQIGRNDTLFLITFSGKTPELLMLLPHLDEDLPLILLTAHTRPDTCEIIRHRPDTILLPAPIHESETKSFGVSAPTTSTTVALTVGDALAIVASRELHPSVASVFAKNHPGGAIGAALKRRDEEIIRDLSVPLNEIATLNHDESDVPLTGADVLRAGYASPSGWVRVTGSDQNSNASVDAGGSNGALISPTRIRQLSSADLGKKIDTELGWLVTNPGEFVSIAWDTTVHQACDFINAMLVCDEDSIIVVMEKGECVGVLEVSRLLQEMGKR